MNMMLGFDWSESPASVAARQAQTQQPIDSNQTTHATVLAIIGKLFQKLAASMDSADGEALGLAGSLRCC